MKRVLLPEKELRQLYEKEGLTTPEIAKRYNCCSATVKKRLHGYNIKPRPPGPPRVDLPKERLEKLYLKKGLSTWEIEKRHGYRRSTVHRKLKKYGIKTRNRAESHIIYPRKDFDGDAEEKAYLIGFALGDLRARKSYENGETIKVDCGSTRIEQINLIKELFGKYGRVWVSKLNKKGSTQVEAFLNLSFSFLLNPKTELDWIAKDETAFIAFFAGFTDAEGSIGISSGKAVYQLSNYDKEILFLIQEKLDELRIHSNIYEDKTKGYVDKEGYIRNQNCWHLVISRKALLLQLFDLIGPYLKHEKRLKDLARARQNIKARNSRWGK